MLLRLAYRTERSVENVEMTGWRQGDLEAATKLLVQAGCRVLLLQLRLHIRGHKAVVGDGRWQWQWRMSRGALRTHSFGCDAFQRGSAAALLRAVHL